MEMFVKASTAISIVLVVIGVGWFFVSGVAYRIHEGRDQHPYRMLEIHINNESLYYPEKLIFGLHYMPFSMTKWFLAMCGLTIINGFEEIHHCSAWAKKLASVKPQVIKRTRDIHFTS